MAKYWIEDPAREEPERSVIAWAAKLLKTYGLVLDGKPEVTDCGDGLVMLYVDGKPVMCVRPDPTDFPVEMVSNALQE